VQLPAGRITLRDDKGKDTAHDIKPIWIGRTEVTWNEYDVFWLALDVPQAERPRLRADWRGNGERPGIPESPPDRGWGHDGSPAGSMPPTWAKAYCAWLSKKTGHHYRLPTEAEWEYACRAGGPPADLDAKALDKVAWYAANADDQTHAVAKKEPNAWGLYDMLGNVAEWVTRDNDTPVVAGGSYMDDAKHVHPAARAAYDPSWQKDDPQQPKDKSWYWNGGHVGFRVVRDDAEAADPKPPESAKD
jgi:formylglycine-generating enzyme required for sulfatase activity